MAESLAMKTTEQGRFMLAPQICTDRFLPLWIELKFSLLVGVTMLRNF